MYTVLSIFGERQFAIVHYENFFSLSFKKLNIVNELLCEKKALVILVKQTNLRSQDELYICHLYK